MARRKKKIEPPPCGIYRTGRALKDDPEAVPAGILLMFHNHSNRGIPMVQLPKENQHNVWEFEQYGPGVEDDDAFLEALQPLREEGFYYLKEPLETPDGSYPAYSLVQLGYNLDGDPILFIGQKSEDENAMLFPETGYRFEELHILEMLGPPYPMKGFEAHEESDLEEADPDTGEFLQ